MQFSQKKNLLIIILFNFSILITLKSFVRDFVESVNVIRVNSIKQRIEDFNKVLLQGDVEVLVDNKIHLWADCVEIDKKQQTLIASKKECGSVIIQNKDFLILADRFFLNLDNKTGYADNIRIQFAEGYVRSSRAEKLGENRWKMEDILYTPCDAVSPHWSIVARKAELNHNYVIQVTGALFMMGKIPFFAIPFMALPIQNRSKSGFLLPKFSYDDDLGFGLKEEFYWSIFRRCDTTIGIDWREKKGIAFFDEFRWARKPESFTVINSSYAVEKNAFVKRSDTILQTTYTRYWIQGKDFWQIKTPLKTEIDSLLRLDFGTDKKIGYLFFDNTQEVDDTFYNSWILRSNFKKNVLNLIFDGSKTRRRRFLPITTSEYKEISKLFTEDFLENKQQNIFSKKREVEDEVEVYKLPHLEINTIYQKFFNIFSFRHDVFLDQIFSRKNKLESFYINSKVIKETELIGLLKADNVRFLYLAQLEALAKFQGNILRFFLNPTLQATTHLKNPSIKAKKNVIEGDLFSKGAYRIFFENGIEWNWPEFLFVSDIQNSFLYFQPSFKWEFLPKFKQDHWNYSDKWDRHYPKNRLSFLLRNNFYIEDIQIDLNIKQAYDFYSRSDIFSLYRSPSEKNLFPLNVELGVFCDPLNVSIAQEYDWKSFRLIQSEINCSFKLGQFDFYLSTIYQNRKLQEVRELYSDLPHFITLGITVPTFKHLTISYDGQFYSDKDCKLLPFEGLKPLIHRIRFDYQGHCWGISVGFEEKNYRQYGNWKSERAFTLFVRLESLGSFARKFKRPVIYNN
ncbi:hypothetical protein GF322_02780 [Candidatus Dependentiae bacterium]|nr:hypothetical protein [Candidatus Dependentiae bacterium]